MKFLFDHDVVKEDALRRYKMERDETTPTGPPEEDLYNTPQMQNLIENLVDDSSSSGSGSSSDNDNSGSSSSSDDDDDDSSSSD